MFLRRLHWGKYEVAIADLLKNKGFLAVCLQYWDDKMEQACRLESQKWPQTYWNHWISMTTQQSEFSGEVTNDGFDILSLKEMCTAELPLLSFHPENTRCLAVMLILWLQYSESLPRTSIQIRSYDFILRPPFTHGRLWSRVESLWFCPRSQSALQNWQIAPHLFRCHSFVMEPKCRCNCHAINHTAIAANCTAQGLSPKKKSSYLNGALHTMWFATIHHTTIAAELHPCLGAIENEWRLNGQGAICPFCRAFWEHGKNRSDSARDRKRPGVNRAWLYACSRSEGKIARDNPLTFSGTPRTAASIEPSHKPWSSLITIMDQEAMKYL